MWRIGIFWMLWGVALTATAQTASAPVHAFGPALAAEWVETTAQIVRREGMSPPRASRLFGYVTLALYEAMATGEPRSRSMTGQVAGLAAAPGPIPGQKYDWPVVMAVAAEQTLEAVLGDMGHRAPAEAGRQRRSHEQSRRAAGVSASIVQASQTLGAAVARVVIARARADGFAATLGRPYMRPTTAGAWEPTSLANPAPVEPYWGTLRPFGMTRSGQCRPVDPIAFSDRRGSPFDRQAQEVLRTSRSLTAEQRRIAQFWADLPGQSATPPGHWLRLAAQLVRDDGLPLDVATETLWLAGAAAHDAFIACWEAKYRWNVLRPETYIRRYIESSWRPLLSTPSFPEYPSGHSTVSGAVSAVLADRLGDGAFTDRVQAADGLGTRRFASFAAAASEAAVSRLYGGIHFPMGNAAGLAQGACVARNVLSRLNTVR